MTQEVADDPFSECELDPEAILGTHTFEDVLFTDEAETPVNVLTSKEDILVADQPDCQSIRVEERLAALLHSVGKHELVCDLLVEHVEATPIGVLDATGRA